MVGLLPVSMARAGLLGMRPRADEFDEQMFMSNPYGRQKMASDQVMATGMKPALMPAPAPSQQMQQQSLLPQRGRVNPLRVLDNFILGGAAGGALDAERQRLEQEAMRPQMQAQAMRLQDIAREMGPRAELAFTLNPEQFGRSISEQFSPQVVAEGGIQSVIGDNRQVRNPRTREFGDSLVRDTPEGVETLTTRGPTISEQAAINKANRDFEIQQARLGVDRDRLNLDESVAGFTVSPGQVRFDASGAPVATVAEAPRPVTLTRDQERNLERYLDEENELEGVKERLTAYQERIAGGQLSLGRPEVTMAAVRSFFNRSTPNDRAISDFRADMQRLVNDSLRLNKGTQTEGDAQREAQTVLDNLDDEGVVTAALTRLLSYNDRALSFRQQRIAALEGMRGQSAPQTGGSVPAPPPGFQLD